MTEELYNKIDKFCNETDWSKYPTYEHALEEFIKGIVAEETEKLQEQIEVKDIQIKELDAQRQYWKDSSFDWRHKFFKKRLVKRLVEKDKQLNNAKELIKKLLALYLSPVVTNDDVKRQDEILTETERFLSEVAK